MALCIAITICFVMASVKFSMFTPLRLTLLHSGLFGIVTGKGSGWKVSASQAKVDINKLLAEIDRLKDYEFRYKSVSK